jgi:GT2 family glycosyltransferase/exopolysaccharide biosynthesis predicted pyruvyltransferase EpsI
MSATAHLSAIESSRRAILDEIGDPPDLTLVRGLGSLGDELIWAGTRELLSDRIYREIDLDSLCRASGDTVLLSGGGALCRPYHEWMPRALAVATIRFERVIVLPSSFDPAEDEVRETLARTPATVFARERESHRRIQSLCDTRLAHDCAFFFDFAPYRREGSGTLNAFRTDREADRPGPLPPNNDDISLTAPGLEQWLETIAAHELVRTDRAHVMIAAALLGKRVEFAPSSYHKVTAIAEYALAEFPVVPLHRAPDPASRRAEGLPRRGSRTGASPLAPPVRVAAIVLTRDRPERALRAVDSVLSSEVSLGALVVDNNSAPVAAAKLVDGCSERERRHVRMRRSDVNLGCGGGRQLGVESTTSELVLFLDDDAELEPGAVDTLVDELDAHPEAAAVTATVISPGGAVHHSGGWMRVSKRAVEFGLLGAAGGVEQLPPSGPADWVPGTAALIRREFLERFPIDDRMRAYCEDNEWSYRVERARPGSFRRSLEARAVHHFTPKHLDRDDFAGRSAAVERLETYAWFYARHGKLLDVDVFTLVPELTDATGARHLEAARLLMELLLAKGSDWVFMEWTNGGLDVLIGAAPGLSQALIEAEDLRQQLADAVANVAGHRQWVAEQREMIAELQIRHETLLRIEQGGWWRFRNRVLPLLGLYWKLRRREGR